LAQALQTQWFGLLPGFHRFELDHGRVLLTLCVGDTLDMLRAQQFEADAVELAAPHTSSSDLPWFFKALARCCRRGTAIAAPNGWAANTTDLAAAMTRCGFVMHPAAAYASQERPAQMVGHFDPPWTLKSTRQRVPCAALPIQRCAVIGASVAAALARRG
jgi:tRNA 5-methylaminomethyl-2-thiouridine biosynthesis bifunctional protein